MHTKTRASSVVPSTTQYGHNLAPRVPYASLHAGSACRLPHFSTHGGAWPEVRSPPPSGVRPHPPSAEMSIFIFRAMSFSILGCQPAVTACNQPREAAIAVVGRRGGARAMQHEWLCVKWALPPPSLVWVPSSEPSTDSATKARQEQWKRQKAAQRAAAAKRKAAEAQGLPPPPPPKRGRPPERVGEAVACAAAAAALAPSTASAALASSPAARAVTEDMEDEYCTHARPLTLASRIVEILNELAAAERAAAEQTVVAAVEAMAEAAVEQVAAEAAAAEIEAAIEAVAAGRETERVQAERAAAKAAAKKKAAETAAAREKRLLSSDRGFVEAPPLIPRLEHPSEELCPICLNLGLKDGVEDLSPWDSCMPCCKGHIHLACFMHWHALEPCWGSKRS